MTDRVVLAYSGGLDTSVAIGWIAEETGAEVIAVAVDVGQGGEDLEAIRERALTCGAVEAEDADVTAYEPVFINGEVAGFCTSGGYSHHMGQSVAFALVPRASVTDDLEVEIELLGKRRKARLALDSGFDPEGVRLRG